jgi:hypothetical protein
VIRPVRLEFRLIVLAGRWALGIGPGAEWVEMKRGACPQSIVQTHDLSQKKFPFLWIMLERPNGAGSIVDAARRTAGQA